jgi:formate dehydrogenase subunit delta
MHAEDIIRMANQIGAFFEPYPEADSVSGIRDHLAKFWDPAMRRELLALAEAQERRESANAATADNAAPLSARVLQAVLAPPNG